MQTQQTTDCNILRLLQCIQPFSLTAEFYNDHITSYKDQRKMFSFIPSNKEPVNNVKMDNSVNDTNVIKTNETKKKDVNFYSINANDQLFWCFLMIINSWDEKDLPQPSDRFSFENKEKMSLTELLQKSTAIPWKEMNITKTSVYSSLSESINSSINTSVLKALAFLCEKNIIYMWGKCYLYIPGGRAYENQPWHVIQKDRTGHKLATDTHAQELYSQIEEGKFYKVKDENKPLMAMASYKLDELQTIASKFNVTITRENGKAKLKKELYQEIVDLIHKID